MKSKVFKRLSVVLVMVIALVSVSACTAKEPGSSDSKKEETAKKD